jgi:adenylosuccinate synthase
MPVSIVVGGQFGSEGKGKVALEIVRREAAAAVIRVGGTNSGHTAVGIDGKTYALRQLPAAAIDRSVKVVLPAGSYIDLDIFNDEVNRLGFGPDQVLVSPMARIITEEHKNWERAIGLGPAIGSTQSGTGAAVMAMTARGASGFPLRSVQAKEVPGLAPFLKDTVSEVRSWLSSGRRVVIEGTQGYGLSVLQGGYWPKATSRDTTAASFLAEAGLSPRDVDDVTMVIRCHPIRVAGDSGPLEGETTWQSITAEAELPLNYREYTTVTGKVRRVGRFDAELVRRAIAANNPSRIVLNHLDYVDPAVKSGVMTPKTKLFVEKIERDIEQRVDWLGVGPGRVIERQTTKAVASRFSSSQSGGRKWGVHADARKSRARRSSSIPSAELR